MVVTVTEKINAGGGPGRCNFKQEVSERASLPAEDRKVTEGASRGMGYSSLFKEVETASAKAGGSPVPCLLPLAPGCLGGNEGREAGPAASSTGTGALLTEGPVLGFMICCYGLEILGYF